MDGTTDLFADVVASSHADASIDASSGCMLVASPFDGQSLQGWLEGRRAVLDACIDRYGAVLLRGFETPEGGLAALVSAYGSEPLPVDEETSPRTHLGDRVFTSTEYPEHEEIVPHNECSYRRACPSRLFFLCERPGASGGQTTLVDGDTLTRSIGDEVSKAFRATGWAYHRRYGTGLGVDAEQAFGLGDRDAIDRYCAAHDIESDWTEGSLVTRQRRAAFIAHPADGRPLWFNHVCFFHHTSVPPALRRLLDGPASSPYDTRFGDDTPIPDETIEHLRDAYRAHLREVNWRAGDLLIVDNLRMAHGRRPYAGRRRLLFAMSDLIHRPRFTGTEPVTP